jgi:hypothetical protein
MAKNREKPNSARLVAGFCWPWSDPNPDGTLVNDVVIGEFAMPWEGREGKPLAPGIPPWFEWAYRPEGVHQVGCIYTARRRIKKEGWNGECEKYWDRIGTELGQSARLWTSIACRTKSLQEGRGERVRLDRQGFGVALLTQRCLESGCARASARAASSAVIDTKRQTKNAPSRRPRAGVCSLRARQTPSPSRAPVSYPWIAVSFAFAGFPPVIDVCAIALLRKQTEHLWEREAFVAITVIAGQ